MFSFEGSGVTYEDNKVSGSNDAISANWSKGISFVGNKITKSASGIHTDNNGGSGGGADTIKENKVSECRVNGYGVWTFAPYVSATIENNKVSGCAVGLAAFGSQVSGQGPTFTANKVNGDRRERERRHHLRRLHHDRPAGLRVRRRQRDAVEQLDPALRHRRPRHADEPDRGRRSRRPGHRARLEQHDHQATRTGANGETGTSVNLENNWWGCKQGPNNSPKCDTATGTVDYTPWLTAKP